MASSEDEEVAMLKVAFGDDEVSSVVDSEAQSDDDKDWVRGLAERATEPEIKQRKAKGPFVYMQVAKKPGRHFYVNEEIIRTRAKRDVNKLNEILQRNSFQIQSRVSIGGCEGVLPMTLNLSADLPNQGLPRELVNGSEQAAPAPPAADSPRAGSRRRKDGEAEGQPVKPSKDSRRHENGSSSYSHSSKEGKRKDERLMHRRHMDNRSPSHSRTPSSSSREAERERRHRHRHHNRERGSSRHRYDDHSNDYGRHNRHYHGRHRQHKDSEVSGSSRAVPSELPESPFEGYQRNASTSRHRRHHSGYGGDSDGERERRRRAERRRSPDEPRQRHQREHSRRRFSSRRERSPEQVSDHRGQHQERSRSRRYRRSSPEHASRHRRGRSSSREHRRPSSHSRHRDHRRDADGSHRHEHVRRSPSRHRHRSPSRRRHHSPSRTDRSPSRRRHHSPTRHGRSHDGHHRERDHRTLERIHRSLERSHRSRERALRSRERALRSRERELRSRPRDIRGARREREHEDRYEGRRRARDVDQSPSRRSGDGPGGSVRQGEESVEKSRSGKERLRTKAGGIKAKIVIRRGEGYNIPDTSEGEEDLNSSAHAERDGKAPEEERGAVPTPPSSHGAGRTHRSVDGGSEHTGRAGDLVEPEGAASQHASPAVLSREQSARSAVSQRSKVSAKSSASAGTNKASSVRPQPLAASVNSEEPDEELASASPFVASSAGGKTPLSRSESLASAPVQTPQAAQQQAQGTPEQKEAAMTMQSSFGGFAG